MERAVLSATRLLILRKEDCFKPRKFPGKHGREEETRTFADFLKKCRNDIVG